MADAEPLLAPQLPPLSIDLPQAVVTPDPRPATEPGIWLPLKLAVAVDLQREQCKELPARCQARLNEADEVCAAQTDAIGITERAAGRLEATQEMVKGAPLSDKLTWGIWGGIIGVVAGVVVTAIIVDKLQ